MPTVRSRKGVPEKLYPSLTQVLPKPYPSIKVLRRAGWGLGRAWIGLEKGLRRAWVKRDYGEAEGFWKDILGFL